MLSVYCWHEDKSRYTRTDPTKTHGEGITIRGPQMMTYIIIKKLLYVICMLRVSTAKYVFLRYLNQSNSRSHSSQKQYFLPFFATPYSSDSDSSSELGFDSGTLLGLSGRNKHQKFVSTLFAESETFSFRSRNNFRTLSLHTLATYSAIPHPLPLSHTLACNLWFQIPDILICPLPCTSVKKKQKNLKFCLSPFGRSLEPCT